LTGCAGERAPHRVPGANPGLPTPELVSRWELARRLVSLGHAAVRGAGLPGSAAVAAVRVAGAANHQLGARCCGWWPTAERQAGRAGAELGALVRRSIKLIRASSDEVRPRLRELTAAVERVTIACSTTAGSSRRLVARARRGQCAAGRPAAMPWPRTLVWCALDTALSDDLVAEGAPRIVHGSRRCGRSRTEVEDRIQIQYDGHPTGRLMEATRVHSARDGGRLAGRVPALNGRAWQGEIDGLPLHLALRRAGLVGWRPGPATGRDFLFRRDTCSRRHDLGVILLEPVDKDLPRVLLSAGRWWATLHSAVGQTFA